MGIYLKNGKYYVRVMINRKSYSKYFSTIEEAKLHEHYLLQRRKFVKEQTNDDYYEVLKNLTIQYNTKHKNKFENNILSKDDTKKLVKSVPKTVDAEIKKVDIMSGVDFERYCATLLRLSGQLKPVSYDETSKSKDYGADIIIDFPNGDRVVIQCKRQIETVGIDAVQEVYASKRYYKATDAAVITNSYFSESAIKLANETKVHLIDRTILQKLIKLAIDYIENVMRKNQWTELMRALSEN